MSSAFDLGARIGGMPKGFGFPLWVTVPLAAAVPAALYPACRWCARLRASRWHAWTRYLQTGGDPSGQAMRLSTTSGATVRHLAIRYVTFRHLVALVAVLLGAGRAAGAQPDARPAAWPSAGRPALTIGDVAARPGTTASGFLRVAAAPGDSGTCVPVTVVHGRRPGPVVALVAGVHGSEYGPILAMRRVARRIDPRALAGSVVVVRLANVPAFLGRTVYTGPVDGKNLNRSYPGRPDGTLTERLAHALTEQVLRPADVVVDLHGGDANEAMRPWVGYYARHGTPAVVARSRELAVAFGFDRVVLFPMGPLAPAEAVYTGAAAVTLGKPAFDVEVGGAARVTAGELALVERGVGRLLRHLGMLPGRPPALPPPVFVERRESVRSAHDGVFSPAVAAGARVRAGAVLGRTADWFGRVVATHRAPVDGEVLMIYATPPVRRGETVAVVAATGPAPAPAAPK